MRIRWALPGFFFILAILPSFAQAPPAKKITDLKPTVILISLDGFRWDYPEKVDTPNLHKLIASGVRAEMIPSFPAKTFPNHYSMVTGLYPGNSGMVANNIWDPETKSSFKTSDRVAVRDSRWWGGEPIWVTAQNRGQKTGVLFWPGSEAEIKGVRPNHWEEFDIKMPPDARVNKVLSWLDLPAEERPTFLTLYFEDTDEAGHDFGPESEEVRAAIRLLDGTIGKLMDELQSRGIENQVNVIVVADHGMAALGQQDNIFLEELFDLEKVHVADWSPVLSLWPKSPKFEDIYKALKGTPHLKVYRKRDIPGRYHYRMSDRIAPIIAVADEGWTITTRKRMKDRKKPEMGTHGFDNRLRSMHAIFIAHGPAFKAGAKIGPFENVNVYPAMAKILGLKAVANDGRLKVLGKVMVK